MHCNYYSYHTSIMIVQLKTLSTQFNFFLRYSFRYTHFYEFIMFIYRGIYKVLENSYDIKGRN
jgi:hypothetical protein